MSKFLETFKFRKGTPSLISCMGWGAFFGFMAWGGIHIGDLPIGDSMINVVISNVVPGCRL